MIDLNRLLYNYQMPSDGGGGDGGDSDGGGDSGGGGDDAGIGGMDAGAGGPTAGGTGIGGNAEATGPGSAAEFGGGSPGNGGIGGSDGYGGDFAGTNVAMSNNPAHLGMVEAGLHNSMYGGLNEAVASGNFAGLDFGIDTNTANYGFNFSKTSFTVNEVTKSSLDFNFDKMYTRKYGLNTPTISTGTIASHLYGMGLTAEEAVTAESLGRVAIGLVLGVSAISVGLVGIQALGQVMGVNGMLSQAEYDGINEAVSVASLMIGTIQTMQTISTITSNFGYMNVAQKTIAIAITALSIKNTISKFQDLSEKYGVNPSEINIADIANMDMDHNGSFISNYEKVLKIQSEQNAIYGTKPNEWQIVDKMAGSVMYDIFMAGGNFNPTQDSSQLMASVGGQYDISDFAKQSLLQEDYLSSLDKFNTINKIYEPSINIGYSVSI